MASAALATFFGASCSFVPRCSNFHPPTSPLCHCSGRLNVPLPSSIYSKWGKRAARGFGAGKRNAMPEAPSSVSRAQARIHPRIHKKAGSPALPRSQPLPSRRMARLSPEFGKLLTG